MADLDEVRRLQAEFQRVQLTAAKQKLSERNIVELVTKLVELKLIEVLYTSDGKEYITPQHLTKEIRDELTVHGGRINLVDLQQVLNVDFSHVEGKVNDMVKHDRNLTLILGQLIDSSYRDKLAEEVNDRLQEQGHVTIAELAKAYDLPPDFVREVVEEKLGAVIRGQVDSQDKDIVFTDSFVSRVRAKIRGALSAVTIPTAVGSIRTRAGCQERLFHSLLDELLKQGRLVGSVSGGRQDKSIYYPEIYTRAQNQWLDSFYAQNGYLEYDSLTRLGVSDVKNTIKKRLKGENLVMLGACCVGPAIQDQLSASVEDALANDTWVDVKTFLPSSLSRDDINELLSQVLRDHQGALVCADTIVASQKLVNDSAKLFNDLIKQKAEKDIQENPAILKGDGDKSSASKMSALEDVGKEEKKEQRRKKATAGSRKEGTGGREIKTKSTKKKGRGRDADDDSDDDGGAAGGGGGGGGGGGRLQESSFMNVKEIQRELQSQDMFADCPEELLRDIAKQLHRPLSRQYQEVAKSIFLQASGTGTSADRKKTFAELQDKVSGLWTNARLFEKGVKLFQDANQANLCRHVLKTICTDITNLLVSAMARDNMVAVPDDGQLTTESRWKLISNLPKEVQTPMSKMHQALSGQILDDFFTPVEHFCSSSNIGIVLKKPDKKKERQLVFAHRQALAEQLRGESEAAMALHLAVVILFQTLTQAMVHAPGRMVPAVLAHLKDMMEEEAYTTLAHFQDLVVQRLQAEGSGDQTAVDTLTKEMDTLLPKVKDIALTAKRKTQAQEEQ
ncbi:E3 UFM1-protein ligase 1-like [Littorina saxatilis]|uniref:E3 UFM1-protein ligase 1 homolog n=1 Tax=Littorina saxatilis TaxID=31220 RepID=A0AAN9BLI3_9CAEN